MTIKVLVCSADGSQHLEEREVPEDYLTSAAPAQPEEVPQ